MMYQILKNQLSKNPWNKGKLMGQKPPLIPQEIWAIRIRLQDEEKLRDLALFNLAIDSKLRASDLLKIKVSDVSSGDHVNSRAMIMQQKTERPVRFEITARTRKSIETWIAAGQLKSSRYLFPSRQSPHLSTRQYARIVESWVSVYPSVILDTAGRYLLVRGVLPETVDRAGTKWLVARASQYRFLVCPH